VPAFLAIFLALLATPAGYLYGAPAIPQPAGIEATDHLSSLLARANLLEAGEPHQALRVAKDGVLLARQQGDLEKEAAFLSSVAFSSTQTGDLVQAAQYANEALALSTRLGNQERMAKAHNILGITYTFMGSYSRALGEGLEGLRIRQQLGLEAATLQSLNLIGVIYHHSGQYEKAIDAYQKILEQTKLAPDPKRVILSNLNIGFAKYKLGRFQEALGHHLLALGLAQSSQDHPYLLYAYVNLGLTYTDLKNYAEATRYLHLALTGYGSREQNHGKAQVLNSLGRLDLLTGNLDRGIKWALEGAALSEEIKAKDELKTSYQLLASLYEQRGQTAQALKYFKLYSNTKDSIFTNHESEKIADISMNLVTLKKDHEIGLLKREQLISALKIQKARYFSFILISGVFTLALFSLILYRYGRKTMDSKVLLESANLRLQALNDELQETIREVRTLSGLLPICAHCKKIRDDDGYWQQLEGYISKHSEATFSHGICPHCAEELYPEATEALRCRHGGQAFPGAQ
jgi:tetratricopeptide (TPR) repeat protein